MSLLKDSEINGAGALWCVGESNQFVARHGACFALGLRVVKGGLIVDIGLRGFLPASLIELRRVRDLTPYLGQEICFSISEIRMGHLRAILNRVF